MNSVLLAYFTPEIINEIQTSTLYFTQDTWKKYRKYHEVYEKITSVNMFNIMKEFQAKCEVISMLPRSRVTYGYLLRLFY